MSGGVIITLGERMDSLLAWIASPDEFNDHHDDDVVPDTVAVSLWMACVRHTHGFSLSRLVQTVLAQFDRATQNEETVMIARLRSALRLCLALAVRCRTVEESEVLDIARMVTEKGASFSSESRFIESGGNCTHAAAFPFASGPPTSTSGWRRHVRFSKRRRVEEEGFKGKENVFSRDVIIHVLQFCDARTVGRACAVSLEWKLAEKSGQDVIWKPLFLRKWPGVKGPMTNLKARFEERVKSIRRMRLPVGRSMIPKPHYCLWCDVAFPTLTTSKNHSCLRKKADLIRQKLALEPKSAETYCN